MLGMILGAAATLGAAALSSSSTKKGADKAAAAEIQVAEKNNALTREFRTENTANFAPNLQSGWRGNALVDSFLYGPQLAPTAAVQPAGPVYDPSVSGHVGQGGASQTLNLMSQNEFLPDYSVGMTAVNGRGAANLARARAQATQPGMVTAAPPAATPAPVAGGANALSGYEAFQASPYYQFPLAEGRRGLDHALAAGGKLESGDALKRAIRYNQDYGAGRMGEFIGLAERQIGRGIQGASSIAGVTQNALTATMANNQNAADATANAALLRAQANQQLIGGVGNALGYLASSYKGW